MNLMLFEKRFDLLVGELELSENTFAVIWIKGFLPHLNRRCIPMAPNSPFIDRMIGAALTYKSSTTTNEQSC